MNHIHLIINWLFFWLLQGCTWRYFCICATTKLWLWLLSCVFFYYDDVNKLLEFFCAFKYRIFAQLIRVNERMRVQFWTVTGRIHFLESIQQQSWRNVNIWLYVLFFDKIKLLILSSIWGTKKIEWLLFLLWLDIWKNMIGQIVGFGDDLKCFFIVMLIIFGHLS